MDKKTYNISRILIMVLLIIGVFISENLILASLFVVGGMILLYIASKNVNEALWDERTKLIKSNASRMAAGIFILIIFFSGSVLLAINSISIEYAKAGFNLLTPSNLGFTLCMALALFWFLYFGFYRYYSRRYG